MGREIKDFWIVLSEGGAIVGALEGGTGLAVDGRAVDMSALFKSHCAPVMSVQNSNEMEDRYQERQTPISRVVVHSA